MLRYMLTGLPPGVSYLEYLESQGTLLPLLKVRGRVRVSLSQQARKYDPREPTIPITGCASPCTRQEGCG